MADNRYNEDEEAQRRIDQIRKGSSGLSQPPSDVSRPSDDLDSQRLDESDAVSRARSRAASARSTLRGDSRAGAVPPSRTGGESAAGGSKARQSTREPSSGSSNQALFIIGGVVLVGILVVALIFALSQLQGGSGPIIALGPSATPTATATETPTATPTETPTPTPTLVAPSTLTLPPLTCIFSSVTCQQYCSSPDNTAECNQARDFISAQDADADFWFACLEDTSGPNEGNENLCLQDAWRANQGAFDAPELTPTLATQ